MPRRILVDAGPIVAYLRATDQHHDWAVQQFRRFPRFVTCEAVLAEACARLAYYGNRQTAVIDLVRNGSVILDFSAADSLDRICKLMDKYANCPMDLADACLVVMTERFSDCMVVTLDARDFAIYRRHEREVVPHLSPRPR